MLYSLPNILFKHIISITIELSIDVNALQSHLLSHEVLDSMIIYSAVGIMSDLKGCMSLWRSYLWSYLEG